MKLATAILKLERVYTQGYAETTSGVWIARGPVYIALLSSINEIGDNIRASLTHSVRGVSHPSKDDWKAIQRPMLEAVGVKSWSALAKGAKAVGIECDDGVVTLTPSCNYEKQGGLDLPDQVIRVPILANELGAKLGAAFDLSS